MVLVTGATGILGRVITLQLLKGGRRVRATKRPSSDLEEVQQSWHFYTENPKYWFDKIEWVDVDFGDIHSLQNALQGVEEVYHCVAKVSFRPSDKKEMVETNIFGTKNLLYACENSTVKKFCHISSIAVLDGVNALGLVDEDSDFNPKLNHSGYAITKHFSEMEVWRAAAEGLNVLVLNPGIILGSGNWKSSSGNLFEKLQKIPFSFEGKTGYIDVRDVAEISIKLMNENQFDERYILISENKKYIEIANFVRRKMNLKPANIIPKSYLQFFRKLIKPIRVLFPVFELLNKANVEALTSSTEISNEKIKKRLGFSFIPIEESLSFHLENYKKYLKKM